MRIWDVPAGYLNRQSLLGEHRELHGLYRIHQFHLEGYARHPETIRWKRCLTGLCQRHRLLAAEMALRGYTDRTPMDVRRRALAWPSDYIDPPGRQLELLRGKYVGREPGRITLPRNAQELWAHHKYSVMARDPGAYRTIGARVARMRRSAALDPLALELTAILRERPEERRLVNAIEHMWGYVSRDAGQDVKIEAGTAPRAMLMVTQRLAMHTQQPYLVASTALSELMAYMPLRNTETQRH